MAEDGNGRGDRRLRYTTQSSRVLQIATDAVKETASEAVKKSPKLFFDFLKLLHVPYLPPIAQQGKRGWLLRYVLGPFNTVS